MLFPFGGASPAAPPEISPPPAIMEIEHPVSSRMNVNLHSHSCGALFPGNTNRINHLDGILFPASFCAATKQKNRQKVNPHSLFTCIYLSV
jgi:hypothetical protein